MLATYPLGCKQTRSDDCWCYYDCMVAHRTRLGVVVDSPGWNGLSQTASSCKVRHNMKHWSSQVSLIQSCEDWTRKRKPKRRQKCPVRLNPWYMFYVCAPHALAVSVNSRWSLFDCGSSYWYFQSRYVPDVYPEVCAHVGPLKSLES